MVTSPARHWGFKKGIKPGSERQFLQSRTRKNDITQTVIEEGLQNREWEDGKKWRKN